MKKAQRLRRKTLEKITKTADKGPEKETFKLPPIVVPTATIFEVPSTNNIQSVTQSDVTTTVSHANLAVTDLSTLVGRKDVKHVCRLDPVPSKGVLPPCNSAAPWTSKRILRDSNHPPKRPEIGCGRLAKGRDSVDTGRWGLTDKAACLPRRKHRPQGKLCPISELEILPNPRKTTAKVSESQSRILHKSLVFPIHNMAGIHPRVVTGSESCTAGSECNGTDSNEQDGPSETCCQQNQQSPPQKAKADAGLRHFGIGKNLGGSIGLSRSVIRFPGPPARCPDTVCLSLPTAHVTHRYILAVVKEKLHFVSNGGVLSVQFVDRNVIHGTRSLESRWIVRLNSAQAKEEMIRLGVLVFNRRVALRSYDEVRTEEYNDYLEYSKMQTRLYWRTVGDPAVSAGELQGQAKLQEPSGKAQPKRKGHRKHNGTGSQEAKDGGARSTGKAVSGSESVLEDNEDNCGEQKEPETRKELKVE